MPNAGIMASAVHIASGPCTDVLQEPFDSLAAWALTLTPTIVAGRNGTALRLGDSGGTAGATYAIPTVSQSDTLTIGFAWRISTVTTRNIMELWSDTNTTQHTGLKINSDGSLSFMRFTATLQTSAIVASVANTWYYIEVQTKLHDTTGFGIVRVNGVEVINVTNTDTKQSGTKTVYDTVRLIGYPSASNNQQFDDLYISTGAGCAFQGDHAVTGCTNVLQEPFDSYARWTVNGTPILATGRNGNAAQITGTSQHADYSIAAASQADTVTIGFAYRTPTLQATGNGIFDFYSDTNTTRHTGLDVTSSGTLRVTRTGTNIGGSAAGIIAVDTWYYIEAQFSLHDTAGIAKVRVNGTEVINLTGLDTKNAGTKVVYDAVRLGPVNPSSGGTNLYDDLYVSTGAGCAFQGDHAVVVPAVLQLWLDADDASTFSYSSGTLVSEWRDKSSNARHFTQVQTPWWPNRNGSQNGRTTVVFDGTDDYLIRTATSWAMSKPVTVFAVARNTAASGQRRVFTTGTDGTVRRITTGQVTMYQGTELSTGVAWGTTNFHLVTAVFNGTASKVARNGGADTSGDAGSTGFVTGGTSAIGRYSTTSVEYWQGDIAEILIYEGAIYGSERADIETALKTKWGIT